MSEVFKPGESDTEPLAGVRLRDLQEAIGLRRYDIRSVIQALKGNPLAEVDCPPKALFAAMESIHIEEIWSNARAWIQQNMRVRGLSDTTVPELLLSFKSARGEASLPMDKLDVILEPIAEETYDILLEDGSDAACESYTRGVLQTHLLLWEMGMKSSTDAKNPEIQLYQRYVKKLGEVDPAFSHSRYPATRKMYAGFSFGQSVFWKLPDTAHKTVIPKLAHSHLSVINEAYTRDSYVLQEGSIVEQQGLPVFSDSFYKEMALRVPHMQAFTATMRTKGTPMGAVAFSDVITSCPAVFTDAFEEVSQWIRDIRSDRTKLAGSAR